MAITNHERVGKAMELLRDGLAPFVEREVKDKVAVRAVRVDTIRRLAEDSNLAKKPLSAWDASRSVEADVGHLERRIPTDARVLGAQSRFRIAQLAQQMGASGALLRRRRGTVVSTQPSGCSVPSRRLRRTRWAR